MAISADYPKKPNDSFNPKRCARINIIVVVITVDVGVVVIVVAVLVIVDKY